MRDKNKNEAYFNAYINENTSGIDEMCNLLKENKIEEDRINRFKSSVFSYKLKNLIAKFSAGTELTILSEETASCCCDMKSLWANLYYYKNGYLKQYISSGYNEMIWMLSLATLLKVDRDQFNNLVEIIDRDGVVDVLFEKIISFHDPLRPMISGETYHPKIQYIPNDFKLLRTAIKSTDKKEMEKLVGTYVTKEWYKNQKKLGTMTLSPEKDSYIGCWCFEAAAFVAILDLDDSSFRDCPYYPKDLVDYFRSK